ncbi:MAG: bifunctional diaminohydroxyphosphoribosylaminopyrimidine deaminase/5-amino-6-(5-phosphoribosylamino)uracil reductase RibD [Actinomyces sp.]|nr:MAG: bifunctional diaminohydroxyphosphoribosylaminopyrimidine deaminase/5-amino-6-(5-phosphoribosylamino)uracil reductase RibD [Actinomyces sp.]
MSDDPARAADATDHEYMGRALAAAETVRFVTSPNPWVGAVVVSPDGRVVTGATEPPGGPHAERVALAAAGEAARGGTLYVTLEPCDHRGRTPPCTEAVIAAGIERVVVGVVDPDPRVAGRGLERLRRAGIEVVTGCRSDEIADQLRPYLHHRRTGRPEVVLKLAATLDGGTAAPDGTSQWITSPEARADAHRLRALSDAIIVGAGTVRADDPALTVRSWAPPPGVRPRLAPPRRIVLGAIPPGARIEPAESFRGDPAELLRRLGVQGVLSVLVEGGAGVAGEFHRRHLVDRYVVYLAPALFGGDDARGLFAGPGAPTIDELWRGEIVDVARVGTDLRVELTPVATPPLAGGGSGAAAR